MASPQRRHADLGVLLVHGMGEQRRGDTLTEAGDALISWLQRWCERPPQRTDLKLKGDVTVLESSLRIADDDELEAPHLTIRLRLPVRTGNPPVEQLVTKHWLVAEAWWSETFRPASFNQLVGWVLGIGPWVLATQFHGLRDRIRIPRAGPRLLTWLLWPTAILTLATLVAATAVLSLLLTILAALVLLLRLVPIGPVQSMAEGIQRSLASSFGDLMVLVQSPSRFGAMRSQVRADLKALANQCDRVVVVAHSQGSHIAWETLRRPADDEFVVPEKTVRLITYGQAMRKLRLAYRVLRRELDSGIGLVGVAALVAQLALGLLLAAGASLLIDDGSALRAATGWFTRPTGLDVRTLLGVLVALVVGGNALLLYRSRGEANDDAAGLGKDVERATEGRDDFRWVDIWSSADPAPNGPLAAGGADAVSSWRVRNAGSVILDHSIYWENLTEFVGAVGAELGRFGAGTPHFPNDRDPFPDWRLRLASLTRGARIHVLSALRAMWLAAVLAIGATLYPTLEAALNGWLPAEIPLIDFLREWLPGILALALIGGGGLVGWVLIGKVWGAGGRADDRAYFAGRIEGPFPWPSWFGLLLLAVVPGAAFVSLWRATGGLMLPAAYALAAAFVSLAAFTFISGGGRGFAEEPAGERVRLSAPLWLTAAVFSGLFIVVNAGWFRPEDDVLTTALAFGVAYAALALPMAAATVIRLRTFLSQHRSLRSSPP